jgi:hypothetical protein
MRIFNVNVYFTDETTSHFLVKADSYNSALHKFLNLVKDSEFDDGIDVDDFEDWNFTIIGDYSEFSRMMIYRNDHNLKIAIIEGIINDKGYQYVCTERG